MRPIDADLLPLDKIDDANYGSNYIRIAPTLNAIVIPDNATNGDVIKALFPKTPHGVRLDSYQKEMIFTTTEDWWDAPYKKE